jgi:hypothetical protein
MTEIWNIGSKKRLAQRAGPISLRSIIGESIKKQKEKIDKYILRVR